jgi:GT2 family glycosyltransferase
MKTSTNPLVSIITVNFNSTAVTIAMLKSLKNLMYSPIEVVVIDNGSWEDPEEPIKSTWPSVIYKRSNVNLGFAGGNNLGISLAHGEYFFFINNDTEVTPSLVTNLVKALEENPGVGIVSPKIMYYQTNMVQYAGYTPMHPITARNQAIGNKQEDAGNHHELRDTPYAHGAAMMTRREVITHVGMMPTNFFLYYEELDWCESIKRAGFNIKVDLSSVIYHKESMSVGKASPLKLFYQTRNRILFVRRNMSAVSNWLFHIYFYLLVSPLKLGRFLIKREYANSKAFWAAIRLANTYRP